jgi:hypothetical protein
MKNEEWGEDKYKRNCGVRRGAFVIIFSTTKKVKERKESFSTTIKLLLYP